MPAFGDARAGLGKEPQSSFNLADEEVEMHDRVWRFLNAPHARGWFDDASTEMRRTRISGAKESKVKVDAYYRWLHNKSYASSRVRFSTLAMSASLDIDTAPSTFASICAVLDVDRRRREASDGLRGLSAADVAARHAENLVFIDWFKRALRYRYDSYGYALDHLLVETPHHEAVDADAQISRLGIFVAQAEQGDFCSGTTHEHSRHADGEPRPRMLHGQPGDGQYRK